MSGTLYVVATPIGNLEDITFRAVRVLREVAVIAAEDTRRTAKLLHHHAIATPTISFHEHNWRSRIPQLLSRLRRGDSIAIVSDAGTPGVSDPGVELVEACVRAGLSVEPIPGASAILAALAASGFPGHPMTFLGFPPNRAKDRLTWFEGLRDLRHTVIFFEAPHRIRSSIEALADILGNRPLVLARELTKIHEEFLRGTAKELGQCLKNPLGEFTVVVGPRPETRQTMSVLPEPSQIVIEFGHLTERGQLTRRQAITELSRKYGRPSREIYAWLEKGKEALS